ncbi:hypothetical protein [Parasphaerochaeta coccoides]|uniref:DUF4177 domain-containing protein n=1 Tax=Parasphaerochaeta coccoides (strain ATCC BAA-1237 / DSM 17374 / SPN1) TaxID=760011 RepID=F4GL22_PARC1|nr:hypothetical protein [Parasphaerochaeta coccoides]AEC02362.1 hypothetical protein Spico_1145 [Parasphaerochaeta coccoides DSM 17374]
MKKCIFFVVIILVGSLVYAASADQYEYMVVSFGTPYFSEFRRKTMAYEGISTTAQEDSFIEYNLDILGRHGWEIVSILETIEGDQQITLKRPYDEKRTTEENKEIGTKVIDEYYGSLIELDAADKAERQKEEDAEFSAAFGKYLDGLANKKPVELSCYVDKSSGYYSVTLTFDITKDYLLNGNGYRKSQVDAFLKDCESILQGYFFEKNASVFGQVYAKITYGGKEFRVGSAYIFGWSDLGKWEWKTTINEIK